MTQQTSLITDAVRKTIGVESEVIANEVEKGAIQRFAEASGDPNPLWNDEVTARKSRYGSLIVPPTFFRSFKVGQPKVEADLPLTRVLDGSSEWEYFEPVRPGDIVYTCQKVVNLQERKLSIGNAVFETREITYKNQFGQLVAIQRSTRIRY